jgi:anti-sigma B factor antagonist
MLVKPTFCVRSRQPNDIGCFGRWPLPASFKTLEAAKQYRAELNLRRGAYHPGYFIERQDNVRNLSTTSFGEIMRATVTSRILSGVVIVDVSGRLCFLETSLIKHVNELLNEGHLEFVLNLADVPYVDSFGLGQLITIRTSILDKGGRLVLLRPSDHVQQLLRLSKLTTVFDILGEETQAVRSAHTNIARISVKSFVPAAPNPVS